MVVRKDIVYRLELKTIPELTQKISNGFSEIHIEMCHKMLLIRCSVVLKLKRSILKKLNSLLIINNHVYLI